MSGEEIIEEYNIWANAITSTEAAIVLLALFWLLLSGLVYTGSIAEQTFKELITNSALVTALLQLIKKD